MERRLIVAFLLSTALIMAYNFLYYGPRLRKTQALQRAQQERLASERANQMPPPGQPVDTDNEPRASAAPIDSVQETAPAAPYGLSTATPETAQRITVTTPLFDVTLTTKGAEVVAIHLREYETDGQPVQLVRSGPDVSQGLLTTELVGEDQVLSLDRVAFRAVGPAGEELTDGASVRVGESSGEQTVVFRADAGDGRRIERYYTFVPGSYVLRTGIRYPSGPYAFARRVRWGFGPGLTATEHNQRDEAAAMKAVLRLGDEFHKKHRGDFEEGFSGTIQFLALKTKYFATIMLPLEPTGGEAKIVGVKSDNLLTASIELPSADRGGAVDQSIDIYAGPLDYQSLKAMGRGLEKTVDVGFDHFKIFQPVSRGILWCMTKLYKVVPNYGLVIIIISVLTKVLFYRLTHKSFKSMRDMQALQPRIAALKDKYKEDKQKLSQETMKLYKEAGVNPLGGCLPMVLQMPVFIALFSVLRNTIEVRRAPFFGWINDLSQQDVLATLPISLPLIGNAVSVLPILMGVSMLVQSKIGGGIAGPESSSTQPKAMQYMLPIVFTFLFYKMPSGLVIYWLVNTVLSVAQQYYINKGAQKEERENANRAEAQGKSNEQKRPKQIKKG